MNDYQKIIIEGLLNMSKNYTDFLEEKKRRSKRERLTQWMKRKLKDMRRR